MSMETENVNVVEEEKEFTSEVKIAGDVIATIAGLAATEVEGIASMQGNLTNELVRLVFKMFYYIFKPFFFMNIN